MKKLFLAVLPILALGLAACGGDSGSGSASGSGGSGASSPTSTPASEPASEPAPATEVTYTVSGFPSWIDDYGDVVFAWVWDEGEDGSWVACTYEEVEEDPTYLTFQVDEEVDYFLLARCNIGTETPDWNKSEHEAGRIHNKTVDYTCTAGTHEYEAPEADWSEYNPS